MIEIRNSSGNMCDECDTVMDSPFAVVGRHEDLICLACAREIVHTIERAILAVLDRKAQDALDAAKKVQQ